jgi:nucleoside-diphosphate-sugar epimerase
MDGRTFDTVIAMYGRLRAVAAATEGRTGRFVSVGGVPAYRGWMNPGLFRPAGLAVPVREDAPTVAAPAEDEKGWRVWRSEQAVFEHHPDATHFRYPYVYGPYQPVPREWLVVRRILDGRRRMVVADDGLTLHHYGYTENLAHALLCALDRPDLALGKVYNAADEEVLSGRQVIEVIAEELGHPMDLVSMPFDLALPAWPFIGQPLPTHRVLDLSALRHDLGYRDAVPPRVALGRTARWLLANPPAPDGAEERVLQDPFDYPAEDRLMDAWQRLRVDMVDPGFVVAPGFGLAYSGPGGRPRTVPVFEE